MYYNRPGEHNTVNEALVERHKTISSAATIQKNMQTKQASRSDENKIAATTDKPFLRLLFPLISLVLFITAVLVIRQIVAEISFAQLLLELSRLPNSKLALAVLFTIGSYVVLTGYDWSALTYIGRRLPFRTVALATFCGTAFSNAVGLNLLSGGSVRYRIYAPVGLGSIDVARITAFGMVAFGIGTTVAAAVALSIYPELIAKFLEISSLKVKWISILVTALFAGLLIFASLRQSPIRIGRWQFRFPSGRVTVAQLAYSVADIVFVAACLYVLIPDPSVPFLGFLVVSAVGIVAGMLSNVPGGLGIFEGIMLVTFKDVIPTESLAAGLLVYRAIYYLVPLVLATIVLTSRELIERFAR